ncbi:uncharacterized protein [Ptychodera flava]|uniref:uncharacterized protein n=1 Tax=Ptychodera flava TaxID=63121 RepID=UPI00396A3AB5
MTESKTRRSFWPTRSSGLQDWIKVLLVLCLLNGMILFYQTQTQGSRQFNRPMKESSGRNIRSLRTEDRYGAMFGALKPYFNSSNGKNGFKPAFRAWMLVNQTSTNNKKSLDDDTVIYRRTRFVINHDDICKNVKTLHLLVLVVSRAEDRSKRDVVRETWAKTLRQSQNVIVLFVVGENLNKTVQNRINDENFEENDLIQMKIGDANRDATSVLVGMFEWTYEFCSNARYLLKIDDTMMVVNEDVLTYLKFQEKPGIALGKLVEHSKPNRDPESTWYVSEDEWPEPMYPPYLLSPVYLLSTDVVQKAFIASFHIKPFRFEDIYLSALLHVAGIRPQGHPGIDSKVSDTPIGKISNICLTRQEFVWGSFDAQQMMRMWNELRNSACKNDYGRYPEEKVSLQIARNNHIDNLFEYKFITDHPAICTGYPPPKVKPDVSLLILTISSAEAEANRLAIRETWGSYLSKLPGKPAIKLFLIGVSENEDINDMLLKEDKKYGDLLIVDIATTDKHKTLMTMVGLKWVHLYCSNARFVMKTDDHIFANIDNILKYVGEAPSEKLVVGDIFEDTEPVRISASPWYVSHTLYPDAIYPAYPSGIAFLVSSDMVNTIYLSAKKTKLFVFEDVYIGMVLKNLGIKPQHHPGFDSNGRKRSTCDLIHLMVSRCSLSDPPAFMFKYWREWQWSEFEECKDTDSEFSYIEYKAQNVSNINLKGHVSRPHSFDFLINHPDACSHDDGVFLLVGVLSSPLNVSTRVAIRETWGRYYQSDTRTPRVKVLYLLGVPPNDPDLQAIVEKENEQYGDIIQQSFVESYDHLVLKSLMLVRYVVEFCQNAKYVLKIDDDVFLNTDNLISFLENAPRTDFYLGDPLIGTEPLRSVRHKWYTPRHVWSDETYPPYCQGPSYLLSSDVAAKIYKESFKDKPFRWEDMYVGILATAVGVVPYPQIHFDMNGLYRDRCSLGSSLVSHHMTTQSYYQYWVQLSHPGEIIDDMCGALHDQVHDELTLAAPGFSVRPAKWTQNEPYSCEFYAKQSRPVYLLIVVRSTAYHYSERKWERLCRMFSRKVQDKQVVVRFMMNTPNVPSVFRSVQNENKMFQDLLFAEGNKTKFTDRTGLMQTLKWTYLNCHDYKYAMFVVDSVYINLENVVSHLLTRGKPKWMMGKVHRQVRVSRNVDDDNYVAQNDWREDVFPSFCDERALIMSKEAVSEIYRASQKLEIVVKNPAAYVGILARRASIYIEHFGGFLLEGDGKPKLTKSGKNIVVKAPVCQMTEILASDVVPWGGIVQNLLNGRFASLNCDARNMKRFGK